MALPAAALRDTRGRRCADDTGKADEIDRAFLHWFRGRLDAPHADEAEEVARNYLVALTLET